MYLDKKYIRFSSKEELEKKKKSYNFCRHPILHPLFGFNFLYKVHKHNNNKKNEKNARNKKKQKREEENSEKMGIEKRRRKR